MTNRAASCVEAVDHLPAGAIVVLPQASWDPSDIVAEHPERSKTAGQTSALAAFRERLRRDVS